MTAIITRVGRMRRGYKLQMYEVYAGRPTSGRDPRFMGPGEYGWLGNPWRVGPTDEIGMQYPAPEAMRRFVEYFEARLRREPEFRRSVLALHGARLLCWCADGIDSQTPGEPVCHAQVIARWIDSQPEWQRCSP